MRTMTGESALSVRMLERSKLARVWAPLESPLLMHRKTDKRRRRWRQRGRRRRSPWRS